MMSAPGFPQFVGPPLPVFLAAHVVLLLAAARALAFFIVLAVRHAAPALTRAASGLAVRIKHRRAPVDLSNASERTAFMPEHLAIRYYPSPGLFGTSLLACSLASWRARSCG
jgi:hypothetical protein